LDDKIEVNEKVAEKFNKYLHLQYEKFKRTAKISTPLKELVDKKNTKVANKKWQDSLVVDLSVMPQQNVVISESSEGINFSTNINYLHENALLYGSIRPYFRKCGFAVGIDYVAGTVHQFVPRNLNIYLWILATIQSDDFHNHADKKSQGSKMPVIGYETLVEYDVALPSGEELSEFNSSVHPFYAKVATGVKENRILKKLKEQYLKKFFN